MTDAKGWRSSCGAAALALLLVVGGCAQTRSIEAQPPRPAARLDTSAAALTEAGLGRLEVLLVADGSPLPADVARVQLRASEVRLHQVDGSWLSFPASTGRFALESDQAQVRSILNTQVPPALFDSIEVHFDEVYLEFGANAGSALTMASPPRAVRRLDLRPEVGRTVRVRLTLNPGASVMQDEACRWHFLPFITADPVNQ